MKGYANRNQQKIKDLEPRWRDRKNNSEDNETLTALFEKLRLERELARVRLELDERREKAEAVAMCND